MPERGVGESTGIDLCVCVPARNEADRLPTLLSALAAQSWQGPIPVAVVVNNSDDDSSEVVERARVRFEGRLAVQLEQVMFAPDVAHAGSARRRAMDNGLGMLPALRRGVLVSTDADTGPRPNGSGI